METLLGALTGLCGVLALVCMVVLGEDILRASCNGPHWRRRIIAVGLLILSLFGTQKAFSAWLDSRTQWIMCYIGGLCPSPGLKPRVEILRKRLLLLNRFASQGKLQPAVFEKAVAQIESRVKSEYDRTAS